MATLTSALQQYQEQLNAPRRQVVDRGAVLRELTTHVAGMMEKIAALDDLVIQFDGTPEGLRFIEAWKRARVIVDAGHGPGEEETPTPPAPAPASK